MSKALMERNGKRIAKILEHVGYEDSAIIIEKDWDLQVYISGREEDCITIEMCAYKDMNGDPLFDPLMRIELSTDASGNILSAKAVYYLSRSIFADIEIYAKDDPDCWNPDLYEKHRGELDERLSDWLDTIDMRGYLTEGRIEKI